MNIQKCIDRCKSEIEYTVGDLKELRDNIVRCQEGIDKHERELEETKSFLEKLYAMQDDSKEDNE